MSSIALGHNLCIEFFLVSFTIFLLVEGALLLFFLFAILFILFSLNIFSIFCLHTSDSKSLLVHLGPPFPPIKSLALLYVMT